MQYTAVKYYESNIIELELELKKNKKKLSLFYLFRLLSFVSFLVFLFLFFTKHYYYPLILFSILCLIAFAIVVKIDLKLARYEIFLLGKLQLNKDELNFISHQYSNFEKGEEFINLNPHLAADFDLFGVGSMFQYLNRCSTKLGKLKFAKSLSFSELDRNAISEKQESINELASKIEFIQNFQTSSKSISENGNELENLHIWVNQNAENLKYIHLFIVLIPAIFIFWITLICFNILTYNSLLIPIAISLIINKLNLKRINKTHAMLGKTAIIFEKYATLIKLVEKDVFQSNHLKKTQERLFTNKYSASLSILRLYKLLNTFDLRLNILTAFFLNVFVLLDMRTYCRLAKWKELNKNMVFDWFEVISEIEMLSSYSVYAFNNNQNTCCPVVSDADFMFNACELGHPLLSPEVRIYNNIDIGGTPSVLIITGANMAGKSTFLRTIAANLILAMNGAPVCAKEFKFSPCDIMSSIKIQDSLTNNESYFYAELLRLKDIIDYSKKQPKTLVVLDEILRGTNTKDKQLGSLGLLETLISQNSFVIIATHDLMIGELENKYPKIVKNHCFEVELTNDQLVFDYKFKNGISQKLNASFLMKKMGIIS